MANCIAQNNISPVYSDNQRCLVKMFIYIQNHDALFYNILHGKLFHIIAIVHLL